MEQIWELENSVENTGVLTIKIGIDTCDSVIVNQQSAKTIQVWEVFKLDNLIVRQVNCVKLVLLERE